MNMAEAWREHKWRYRATYGLLAVLLLLGLGLRSWRLGDLNFWGDEDITALAAKGILEHGYPQFPSGMIYFRSMLTTYLSGASAALFGLNEAALRLPSVGFSLATIVITFFFAQRLFSPQVGLLAAFVLTFSHWELEFGRHARMYASFAFFYTFALYAIYRGVYEHNRKWLALSFLGAWCAVFSHVLGGTLGLVYLAAALHPSRSRLARVQLVSIALVVMLAAHAEFWLVQYGFQISAKLQNSEAASGSLQLGSDWFAFLLRFFGDTLYLSTWNPPLFWLGLFTIGFVFWFQRAEPLHARQWLLPMSTMFLLLFHQVLWAILVLWFYLLCRGRGFYGLQKPVARLTLIMIFLFGLFWTMHFLLNDVQEGATWLERLIAVLKFQSDRPKFYYMGLLRAFPLMALVAGCGLLWLFHDNTGERYSPAVHFLLLVFTLSLVTVGFIKTDWVEYRLNFHLNPLFVISSAAVLVKLFERFALWRKPRALPLMLGAVLLVCEQVYPTRIANVVARDYGSPLDSRTAPGSHLLIMPDHQGPAQYVKQQAARHDIVIAMDWLEQSFYGGKIDYWLRTNNYVEQSYQTRHEYFDLYTNTQVVADVKGLQRIIAERGVRNVWIVTASPYTEMQLHVSHAVLEYLAQLETCRVFRGRDKKSFVYKIKGLER